MAVHSRRRDELPVVKYDPKNTRRRRAKVIQPTSEASPFDLMSGCHQLWGWAMRLDGFVNDPDADFSESFGAILYPCEESRAALEEYRDGYRLSIRRIEQRLREAEKVWSNGKGKDVIKIHAAAKLLMDEINSATKMIADEEGLLQELSSTHRSSTRENGEAKPESPHNKPTLNSDEKVHVEVIAIYEMKVKIPRRQLSDYALGREMADEITAQQWQAYRRVASKDSQVNDDPKKHFRSKAQKDRANSQKASIENIGD